MTIHKSKGLEFDHVTAAGTSPVASGAGQKPPAALVVSTLMNIIKYLY